MGDKMKEYIAPPASSLDEMVTTTTGEQKRLGDLRDNEEVASPKPKHTPSKEHISNLIAIYKASKRGGSMEEVYKYVLNYDHAQMANIVERGVKELGSYANWLTVPEMEFVSLLPHKEQYEVLNKVYDPAFRKTFFADMQKRTFPPGFRQLRLNELCFEAATDDCPKHKLEKKIRNFGNSQGRKFSLQFDEEKSGYDVTRVS